MADVIEQLAERFWRATPREIQDSGLTREQWYAREMRAAFDPKNTGQNDVCDLPSASIAELTHYAEDWRDRAGDAAPVHRAIAALKSSLDSLHSLEATRKLLIQASIGSCTCGTKTPNLMFHAAHCRFVLLQYALENVESAVRGNETRTDAVRFLEPSSSKQEIGDVLTAGGGGRHGASASKRDLEIDPAPTSSTAENGAAASTNPDHGTFR